MTDEEPGGDADLAAVSNEVITERLLALGQLVEVSAQMEHWLRATFCALVGSKYAAVVAGGQSVAWLIGQCRALTDVHWDLPDQARDDIKAALALCDEANARRNTLVHGVKTGSRLPDGVMHTIRSRQRRHVSAVEEWTPAKIREAVMSVADARGLLAGALERAVSPELAVIHDALAWEERRRREAGL